MTAEHQKTARGQLKRRAVSAYIRIRRAVEEVVFERRYGLHTVGIVHLEELGLEHDDRLHYEPSEWRILHRILPRDDVSPEDVFIDFGSGMGRVLFEAAQYRFRRVIGVELSEELNRIARTNIARNAGRLNCRDVSVVTSDALSYAIPDDASVLYFANPFQGETFRRVIERVLESYDRRPRRMRLIYFEPVEKEALERTGRVRLIRRGRSFLRWWRRLDTLLMYEVLPDRDDA